MYKFKIIYQISGAVR